jgi:hypothetical protein
MAEYYFDLIPIELIEILYPLIKIEFIKLPNFKKYKKLYESFIINFREGNFKPEILFGHFKCDKMVREVLSDLEYWNIDDGATHRFFINDEEINYDNESYFKKKIESILSPSNGSELYYFNGTIPYWVNQSVIRIVFTILSNNKYYVLYTEYGRVDSNHDRILLYTDNFKYFWDTTLNYKLKYLLLYQNKYVELDRIQKYWMDNNIYWGLY